MDQKERLKLLRSVRLLEAIPENQLATLSEFLAPVEFADGAVIFAEGSTGDSLYFVTSGRVRISKSVAAGRKEIRPAGTCGTSDTAGVSR